MTKADLEIRIYWPEEQDYPVEITLNGKRGLDHKIEFDQREQ